MLRCDIDDLREINSRFRHLEGDAALAVVVAASATELRTYDLCARFGGDEFLVVLPETDEAGALAVARRIQEWLEENPLPTRVGRLAVGVSIGVGSLHEGDDRIGDVIARADAAMYEEKRAGGRSFLTAG